MFKLTVIVRCALALAATLVVRSLSADTPSKQMAYQVSEIARFQREFRSWLLPDAAVSDDGMLVAITGLAEDIAIVWDTAREAEFNRISFGTWTKTFHPRRFDPEKHVLAATSDHSLSLVGVRSGMLLANLPPMSPFAGDNSVAFSPSGTMIAYMGHDFRVLRVYRVADGTFLGRYRFNETVTHVSFATDNELLCITPAGDYVFSVEAPTLKVRRTWKRQVENGTRLLAVCPMKGIGLFSYSKGSPPSDWIAIQNLYSGNLVWQRPVFSKERCAFSSNGRWTAVLRPDSRSVDVYDTKSGRRETTLNGSSDDLRRLEFSANGSLLIGTTTHNVHVWDVVHSRRATYCHSPEGVRDLAVTDDGDSIAVEDQEGTVWIWNRDGSLRRTVSEGSGLAMQQSSLLWRILDDRMVAFDVASGDKNKEVVLPLEEYRPGVSFLFKNGVADWDMSDDGSHVAYLFADNGVGFYDIRQQTGCAVVVRPSIGPQTSVALAPGAGRAAILYFNPLSVCIVDFDEGRNILALDVPVESEFSSPMGRGAWYEGVFYFTALEAQSNALKTFFVDLDARKIRQVETSAVGVGHPEFWPSYLSISRRSGIAAFGDEKGMIRLVNLGERKSYGNVHAHTGPIAGMAFVKQKDELVSVGIDGSIAVWELRRAICHGR